MRKRRRREGLVMKRNVFGKFRYADDDTSARLAAHFSDDSDRRERIFELSERRFKEMKENENEKITVKQNEPEMIELGARQDWIVPVRYAAACLAVLVIGAAAFGVLRARTPETASVAEDGENCIVSEGTYDEAETEQGSEAEMSAESRAESAAGHIESEKTASGKNAVKDKNAEPQSEKSESEAEQKPNIPPVPMPATEVDENGSYLDQVPSDPAEAIDTTPAEEDRSVGAEDPSEDEGSAPLEAGYTTSEKARMMKPNMTCREVFDLLGEPETCGMESGYAQYIIDDDRLLMIRYDYEDDIAGLDGILLNCGRLSDMYSDPESNTFDCYIVDYNGASIRVTCPQYPLFDCASIGVGTHSGGYDAGWNEIIGRAMAENKPLRITHTDEILEIYPPLVTAVSIELAP